MSVVQNIIEALNEACCPEDVLWPDPDVSFKKLAKFCHPDVNDDPLAEQTFQKLSAMKDEADARMKDGTWGKKMPLPHCLPLGIGKYQVVRSPYIGDVADVYKGKFKEMIVKVVRHNADNDLFVAEREALAILKDVPPPVDAGVPRLLDSFSVGTGIKKRNANVLTRYPGFWTAKEVHSVMAVDERTITWMFKRLLTVLTWVHHFDLVHGAILPPHVMFYPDNDGGMIDSRKHTVRLIDWCYSVNFKTRTRVSAWVPEWKNLYAPELLDKSHLGPESDIYMAARLMVYLHQSGRFVKPLAKVLIKCLEQDPKKRYKKAGDALEAWKEAAVEAFGKPKWHDFVIPTTPSGKSESWQQ